LSTRLVSRWQNKVQNKEEDDEREEEKRKIKRKPCNYSDDLISATWVKNDIFRVLFFNKL